jgi:hypothetical protein
VGRAALDEDCVRMIQATHPDVDFDWPQLLKTRPDAGPDRIRPEPAGRSDRSRSSDRPEKQERRARPEGRADSGRKPDRKPAPTETATVKPLVSASGAPEPPSTAAASGPAGARLGPAGLDRLRARFREIAGRIQSRVEDESRRAELNELAERLNPDAWGTDASVSEGLEGYEATYETLKNAIGGRRKPPAEPVGPGEGLEAAGEGAAPDGPTADESR